MQGSAWVDLIRRIPEAQHNSLVVVTATGSEIMVQRILFMESDFIIFRGRPVGSTDEGRVLLLPFDQLNHLALNRALPEKEVVAMFGTGQQVVQAVPEKAAEKLPTDVLPEAAASPPQQPEPLPPSNPPPAPPATAKASPPSKSILLARLRARLAKD